MKGLKLSLLDFKMGLAVLTLYTESPFILVETRLFNLRRRHVDTVPNMAQAVLRQTDLINC